MQAFASDLRDPVGPFGACDQDGPADQERASGASGETERSLLLQRHARAIYLRCLQRLGNVQDAEDALQETMLRVLHGIRGFEGRSTMRTWLFSIADNECNSLIRRRKRHQYSAYQRCLIRLHEENRLMPRADDWERRRRVHNTLMRLSPQAYEVLGLRFFGDASLDEIARILGISLSAAKMRLYRALDMFAVRYSDSQSFHSAVGRLATSA